MSKRSEVFGTAVNCMDGRTVYAVLLFFKRMFGIRYVDTITDAGPVQHCTNDKELERVMHRVVDVSVGKHGSKHVAVVAHEECAGNPISKSEQLRQLSQYVSIVRSWFPGDSEVIVFGLWCERRQVNALVRALNTILSLIGIKRDKWHWVAVPAEQVEAQQKSTKPLPFQKAA